MATDAFVRLEHLTCTRESDGTGNSEPYIWPVVLWVDNDTLATPELVGLTGASSQNARIELKSGMKAGQVVGIPTSVGVHRVRFKEGADPHVIILAVVLWEWDETPETAMKAGFRAFPSELRAAVGANLIRLNGAKDNETERDAIIAEISTRVRNAVKSAISGALTLWQRIRIGIGTLNLDDVVGDTFVYLPDLAATPIKLAFQDEENEYQIDGRLEVQHVNPETCQAQIAAVSAAQIEVDRVATQIAALQAELQDAAPSQKPAINAQIKRLRDEEGRPAQKTLDEARRALQKCRDQNQ